MAGAVAESGRPICAQAAPSLALQEDVTIPFEVVNENIFLQVQAGGSRAYWFVLDTGWKYAVIDLAVAKALGLKLGAPVDAGGGGKKAVMGNMLSDSPFSLVGLKDFSQPLFLALPMDDLAKISGHEWAGILGTDFISEFVVQIDYLSKTITLHNKMTYQYRGKGQSFPVTFNAAGWPVIQAAVIDGERPAIEGKFVLDIGNNGALLLNRPFVESEHFLRPDRHTVPLLEGRALGGGFDASLGRITGLRIGRFLIKNPVTVFSRAADGPFAATESQGNIGAMILEKFEIILDYAKSRVILEPNSQFAEPIQYDRSGLSLVSFGEGYKDFKIDAVAENSPASEVGLLPGDLLVEVNGSPASAFSLSDIRQTLKEANQCDLTVRRGSERRSVKLKLRPRV
jgi:hypothetical protein